MKIMTPRSLMLVNNSPKQEEVFLYGGVEINDAKLCKTARLFILYTTELGGILLKQLYNPSDVRVDGIKNTVTNKASFHFWRICSACMWIEDV